VVQSKVSRPRKCGSSGLFWWGGWTQVGAKTPLALACAIASNTDCQSRLLDDQFTLVTLISILSAIKLYALVCSRQALGITVRNRSLFRVHILQQTASCSSLACLVTGWACKMRLSYSKRAWQVCLIKASRTICMRGAANEAEGDQFVFSHSLEFTLQAN
jgi:hypothetical protein